MTKTLSLIIAALLAVPAYAADSYTIDTTHTWPSFEINHLGYSTQRGRFNKTSGTIMLDIAAKKGSVDITIDTGSLDMGFQKWDDHLKSPDFFDAEVHPTIRFTSDKLIFDGDKVVGAEGHFTLLGVTKPLKLTVSNFHCAPHPMTKKMHCGADISTTIQRSQFGMTKYVPLVGDEVRLYSPVEANKD
ncbi:MAG: polyisoprenoid-binding protein [Nitrosomonadales bacterium]|nr:polyisoprenoid-binding protein [Nitrosomonadales bacterium]